MADLTDAVVVGGGIGGASLSMSLARAGMSVVVLEATTEYQDRVRGESMFLECDRYGLWAVDLDHRA